MEIILLLIGLVVLLMTMNVNATYKGVGDVVKWLNEESSVKVEGQIVILPYGGRHCLGVCKAPIAADGEGSMYVRGLFEMPAVAAGSWNVGEPLYWDSGNNVVTDVATTNVFAGLAGSKKYVLDTTAWVNLNQYID